MPFSKDWIRLVINMAGLLSNVYGFQYILHFFPESLGVGGIFQFLTILVLTVATSAFALKVLRFAMPGALEGLSKTIVYVAMPMEGLISLLYWPMMLYNRELLMSHEMVLPLSIDASLHLWPAVLLWLDFLVFDADFQRSRMHVITIYCFTLFYLCWTTYCFSHNGFWPYPFLAEFSTLGRASFYMFCGTACVLMYEAGASLHSKIHGLIDIAKKDQ